jgi:hypothetical protein
VRSERIFRGLPAVCACLGLMLAGVPMPAAGAELVLRICGSDLVQRIPLPSKSGRDEDCPSPCHATCPRKHTDTGFPQEEDEPA